MTFDEMRTLFPGSETMTYLNHAGVSPIARPVAEAGRSVLDDLFLRDPVAAFSGHIKRQETLRATLGRMINAAPATLGFIKNTSHGLSIASQAIPFTPGDVIITAASEYPSNIYPWMAQEWRGVRTRLVAPDADGIVREDDLIAACEAEPTTRVLAVSWVQWGTGQRMDLPRLGAFCRSRGIVFVVDVVQGLGALRLDVERDNIDIAAAGCHKWLMAPGGIGVLYIRPEVFSTLLPVNIGWNSVTNPIDWERQHFDELKPTTDRFEEGTPSILNTATLGASVRLMEEVGFDRIEQRVLHLADHARTGLTRQGCRVLSPQAPEACSGIVAFRHPSRDNSEVLAHLGDNGVTVAVRCGNVRISPHAYNTESDIDKAIALL
ncbi:MAG: aminotransferase class V-fold PLP-dependent enzyme [Armatimonadota bacterium]